MIEQHPNWFHDFHPMHSLILGSFPPHQSKHAFPFYYPNKQNRFWKVASLISEMPLEVPLTDKEQAVEERKRIMEKLKVGIHDVGLEIKRSNNSSLDSNITILKYQDIRKIVANHPELRQIVLLGFSAKNSAAHAFMRYLKEENIPASFPADFKIKSEQQFTVRFDERIVDCVILNSTSSASTVSVETLVNQFSNYLK
ncbi:hypothetical protein FSS13T_26170 [Flavobacterium saliperosum S13]|uniref:G/U mismatch-specific uracil-DNA glycosylase n=2 Tax=Flavobacterium saliperosum TaxID=329186 RepID=A0A1G4W8L3_9FLAO|nr:hypothetical protein [Flavobacterium saliperosum]ESU22520.1 hypothetical protein FSS13T_26170 [Flavobacterium saliperosum S13]SCX18576.1 G/U mismatch-specific uracil-DNA glycosylase [Flavobacterium saliperosum]